MRKILGFGLVMVVILAFLLTAGCSKAPQSGNQPGPGPGGATAKEPLKIGVVLGLTGPLAGPSGSARNGILMAVEEINAKGGVNGQPLSVKILDDQSKETEAVLMAKQHLADGVSAIIGTTSITTTNAMKNVIQEANIPLISLGGVDPIVQPVEKNQWTFVAQATTEANARKFVEYARKQGWKKIGMMTTSTVVGPLVHGQLTNILKEYPDMKITTWEKYEPDATDTKPQGLKVKNTNPDVIFLSGTDSGSMVAVKDLLSIGVKVPVVHCHGMGQQAFLTRMGKDVDGSYVLGYSLLVADQLKDSDPEKTILLKHISDYQKKYNRPADQFSASGVDAINLLSEALKKAGSTKPQALRDSLESIRGHQALLGRANYSANDHRAFGADSFRVLKVKDGKWTLVE